MKLQKTKPSNTAILSITFLLIVLASCTKNENTTEDRQYRLTKITSHYFGGFADTTDYYSLSYSGDTIIKLIGKWNDEFRFKYKTNLALNRTQLKILPPLSTLHTYLDSSEYTNPSTQWHVKYVDGSLTQSARSDYSGTTSRTISFSNGSSPVLINRARITYNAAGDIGSIGFYNGNPDTLIYTINISYTNTENKFNLAYSDFTMIDPFCRSYGIDSATGHGYPVSIHYGKKCISSFVITKSNGSTSTHNVSYNFNDAGYITKILIDNKSFMSYEYIQQ